ncbi:MAG: hypothetical protein FWD98_00965 [Defluviitaleaceae bacterium]|nr:hypothetical protein [Defluviitaleaceae bacterium]
MEKKGISKREKVMLIFIAVFGVTALSVMYGILPLNETMEVRGAELSRLELERVNIEMLFATEETIAANHAEAAQAYTSLVANMPEKRISDVGFMLTQLVQEHYLAPIEQRLFGPSAFQGSDALQIISASMVVSGSYAALMSLMDTVEATDYLRISNMTFSFNESGVAEINRINLSFEVLMVRDVMAS